MYNSDVCCPVETNYETNNIDLLSKWLPLSKGPISLVCGHCGPLHGWGQSRPHYRSTKEYPHLPGIEIEGCRNTLW